MIKRLLQIFEAPATEQPPEVDSEERVRVATCALLVEMAQVDEDFSESEKEKIVEIMCEHYDLSQEYAHDIIQLAHEELQDSVQLWRFTSAVNKNYSNGEKLKVIEMVWRVVYADGKLNQHEDYLVHRLAKLLNLTHRQLIDAKLKVPGRSVG